MQPPYPYGPQNPHAAPGAVMYRQNVFVPYGAASGPLVGSTLRMVKLGLGIAQLLTLFVGIGMFVASAMSGHEDAGILAGIGGLVLMIWYFLLFGYAIANMFWLHKFWSWIPPDQRHSSLWKKYISPSMVVGFMFIPYFNIYWMFVVYLGIADIMERLRVQYPTQKGPAKTLAIMTLVIPLLFFPAGPFLQFFFAKHVEDMAREMQSRMAGGPMMAQGY